MPENHGRVQDLHPTELVNKFNFEVVIIQVFTFRPIQLSLPFTQMYD